MEMLRGAEIVEVEVMARKLRAGAKITEDVPHRAMVDHHGDARAGAAVAGASLCEIHALLAKIVERFDAEHVAGCHGREAHFHAQRGAIMRQDRSRTSQGDEARGCEQLTFHRHDLRDAVENQVKIDLARDGDVEPLIQGYPRCLAGDGQHDSIISTTDNAKSKAWRRAFRKCWRRMASAALPRSVQHIPWWSALRPSRRPGNGGCF